MVQPIRFAPDPTETVVGCIEREALSALLVALHRAGLGPHSRVLDPARGDLDAQLRRANLRHAFGPDGLPDPPAVVVAVAAPGRAARVADILLRHGASTVRAVGRPVAPAAAPAAGGVLPIVPPIAAPDLAHTEE